MDGGEPDIPIYKVIECTGPTNTRVYKVAVYFRGKRLASSTGHSIQQAEMEAAKKALENSSELFPQLDYQKRVMAHSMKRQKGKPYDSDRKRIRQHEQYRLAKKKHDDDSNLPKQYRVREQSKDHYFNESDSHSDMDSSSDSDSHSSDSSHSNTICSTEHGKKLKHSHVGHKDHEHKCAHNSPIEDDEPQTSEENSTKLQTISNNDIDNENLIQDKQNATDSSDTDISLESGEIP